MSLRADGYRRLGQVYDDSTCTQHIPIMYLNIYLFLFFSLKITSLKCKKRAYLGVIVRKAQFFFVSLHNFFGDNINEKHTRRNIFIINQLKRLYFERKTMC